MAFASGAALAHLHLLLARPEVPRALLCARLALRAAEACVALSGRPERAPELRDAVAFLQPGDRPGPAGEIYLSWRRAVERPVSAKALRRALPSLDAARIAGWLKPNPQGTSSEEPADAAPVMGERSLADASAPRDPGQGGPIPYAATVLQTVLADDARAHAAALLLAEAVLAKSLGWAQIVPLLSLGLTRRDLQKTGAELRAACHRAVASAAVEVSRNTADLSRRTARLLAVAPKLRAKGAEEAVALFLTRDAIAPPDLTSLRSDRAARRFCDRLIALGAVCELTGRETFRLYGV